MSASRNPLDGITATSPVEPPADSSAGARIFMTVNRSARWLRRHQTARDPGRRHDQPALLVDAPRSASTALAARRRTAIGRAQSARRRRSSGRERRLPRATDTATDALLRRRRTTGGEAITPCPATAIGADIARRPPRAMLAGAIADRADLGRSSR